MRRKKILTPEQKRVWRAGYDAGKVAGFQAGNDAWFETGKREGAQAVKDALIDLLGLHERFEWRRD